MDISIVYSIYPTFLVCQVGFSDHRLYPTMTLRRTRTPIMSLLCLAHATNSLFITQKPQDGPHARLLDGYTYAVSFGLLWKFFNTPDTPCEPIEPQHPSLSFLFRKGSCWQLGINIQSSRFIHCLRLRPCPFKSKQMHHPPPGWIRVQNGLPRLHSRHSRSHVHRPYNIQN